MGRASVRRTLVAIALAIGLCGAAAPAHAQAVPTGFGIERFQLAIDRAGLFDVDAGELPDVATWSIGAWEGFADKPLVIYDQTNHAVDALVSRRITTGLVGAYVLHERIELSAALGVIDDQATTAPMTSIPTAGLGDARLAVKLLVARWEHAAIAVIPAGTIPLGSATGFLRDDGPVFEPEVAASASSDQWRVAGDVGFRLRKQQQIAGLAIDDEAFARGGVGYELGDSAATELAVTASVARPVHASQRNQIAAELLVGVARGLSDGLRGFVAGGAGLDNGYGTPAWRALIGVQLVVGAPRRTVTPPKLPVHEQPPEVPVAPVAPVAPVRDADGTLAGRIVGPDGQPIAGARVVIVRGGAPAAGAPGAIELTADASGAYSAKLPPGEVDVTVTARGFAPSRSHVVITAGTAAKGDVAVARAARQGQLRGQVQGYDGKPIAAMIRVTGAAGAAATSATADDQGMFQIDLPNGSFKVEISAPGFATQTRSVTIKQDGVTVLNADLRAAP